MIAAAIAEEAGIRLVTVPLLWPVRGILLRCPTGRLVNVLVSDHLDSLERYRVVDEAIRESERGSRARLIV